MTETETRAALAHGSAQEGLLSAGSAASPEPRETDQGSRGGAVAVVPAPSPLPAGAVTHRCGAWWTGNRTSHCAAADCHRTFSSITAFDRHHRNLPGGGVECIDPAAVGLVAVEKPFGILWSCPRNGDGSPHAKSDDE